MPDNNNDALPIDETYTVLEKGFEELSIQTSDSINKAYRGLYALNTPLNLSGTLAKLNEIKNITDSEADSNKGLEDQFFEFIALSKFSRLYGKCFESRNVLTITRHVQKHRLLSKIIAKKYESFLATLKKQLTSPPKKDTVIKITTIFIDYLSAVENSTMSVTAEFLASLIGFNFASTKENSTQTKAELNALHSSYSKSIKEDDDTDDDEFFDALEALAEVSLPKDEEYFDASEINSTSNNTGEKTQTNDSSKQSFIQLILNWLKKLKHDMLNRIAHQLNKFSSTKHKPNEQAAHNLENNLVVTQANQRGVASSYVNYKLLFQQSDANEQLPAVNSSINGASLSK